MVKIMCEPAPAEGLGWVPGRLDARAGALLVLATLGASYALDALLSLLDLRPESVLGELALALHGIAGLDLVLALLSIGLLPAFAEELLCRGVVQRSLLRRFPPAIAIACSSLIFALLHGEAIHALLALPLGVHLGIVAWWSGSIRLAVLCHAANNLGAVLLAAASLELQGSPWIHMGMGAMVALGGWGAVLSTTRLPPAPSELQPDPGMDDP